MNKNKSRNGGREEHHPPTVHLYHGPSYWLGKGFFFPLPLMLFSCFVSLHSIWLWKCRREMKFYRTNVFWQSGSWDICLHHYWVVQKLRYCSTEGLHYSQFEVCWCSGTRIAYAFHFPMASQLLLSIPIPLLGQFDTTRKERKEEKLTSVCFDWKSL